MSLILLTGFEKFGKLNHNLSASIVSKFPNYIEDFQIEKVILPVKWKSCLDQLHKKLASNPSIPNLILLTGIHNKKYISVEKRALNFQLGIDEEGHFRCRFINLKSPLSIMSNVNFTKLLKISKDDKLFNLSDYPGLFLCNYIYYNALNYYKQESYVVFIHFPNSGSVTNCISILTLIIHNVLPRI